MTTTFLLLFFKLVIGHALADFGLQSKEMANGKNRYISQQMWFYYMFAHCLMHAGVVWFITGLWMFALIELAAHFVIDMLKCDGVTNIHHDQLLHVVCKLGYAAFL